MPRVRSVGIIVCYGDDNNDTDFQELPLMAFEPLSPDSPLTLQAYERAFIVAALAQVHLHTISDAVLMSHCLIKAAGGVP